MADSPSIIEPDNPSMVFGRSLLFWLRWGGFCICLISGIDSLQTSDSSYQTPDLHFLIRILVTLLYASLFVLNLPSKVDFNPRREWWLLPQVLVGVVLDPNLATLSAFCIPFCVPTARRYRWLALLIVFNIISVIIRIFANQPLYFSLLANIFQSPLKILLTITELVAVYLWYGFCFLGACLLFELAKRQLEQQRANQELLSLQAALLESTRYEERFRLSRELHDSVGHYLTSLSIQLEIASHHASDAVMPSISRAQLITRLMLAETREFVSSWREDDTRDLAVALRRLLRDLTAVQLHLDLPDALPNLPFNSAHNIYRCTQEAVTNVLRHSGAQNLWITLTNTDHHLKLTIKDDGRGCDNLDWGNGLRGIESRVRDIGGRLVISTQNNSGFQLELIVPNPQEHAA